MKLHRLIMIFCCMTFSLTARYSDHGLPAIDAQHYKRVLTQFELLIDAIASIVDNQKIQTSKNLLNLKSQENIAQQYAYVWMIVDWALKDCKMMNSVQHCAMLEKKLHVMTKKQLTDSSTLLAMQRHNRAQVKEIISYLLDVPGSICLQAALKDMYHALHEVKKQIVTIDKATAVSAWYIYATMLFLDLILMQAITYLELSIYNKVEQQAFMHQFCCIIERFTQTIRSNFMI